VNQTGEGLTVTTNRDQVGEQFTTDIQIEVPSNTNVSITDSYGAVGASGIHGSLTVKASYGQADVTGIRGNVRLALIHSDITASNIDGDLTVTWRKKRENSKRRWNFGIDGKRGEQRLRRLA